MRGSTRRAVVTGGGNGIGAAAARHLAKHGFEVVIADIQADAAEQVAREIGGVPWVVDLDDTEALAQQLADSPLEVDVLVNNAGFQKVEPLTTFDRQAFGSIMRIMVESPFLLIQSAMTHMQRRRWGRIVNVSSVHGLRASPHKAAYVAAKHGLEGLSKVAALEGAQHNITSNCVNPGFVRTGIVEAQIADQARLRNISSSAVLEEVMLARSAIKRLIEPEEVAAAIGYLVSDAAAMVTGASWSIDGGWTAH